MTVTRERGSSPEEAIVRGVQRPLLGGGQRGVPRGGLSAAALLFPAGPRGHRVEVCSNKALDELLRRRRHPAHALQRNPEPQVPLVPGQVAMDTPVQEKDAKEARELRNNRGKDPARAPPWFSQWWV